MKRGPFKRVGRRVDRPAEVPGNVMEESAGEMRVTHTSEGGEAMVEGGHVVL